MNCRRNVILLKGARLHRNMILVLLTTVFILLCVLIGSSIADTGQSAAKNDSYKYYTSIEIEKGDTLWTIAEEYITSEYVSIQEYVEDIKEVNNLGDDEIHFGQHLMVPYFSEEVR